MQCSPGTGGKGDLLSKPWPAFLLFWLPAIAIVVTANSAFSDNLRTAVWTGALITMGTGCVVNAARCRRTHCYLTGPFFVLMAIVTLLYGLGILPMVGSWKGIGLTILVGGIVFCCLPEMFFGKYRKGRTGFLSPSKR